MGGTIALVRFKGKLGGKKITIEQSHSTTLAINSKIHFVQCCSSSFHIEFHELYWSIIKCSPSTITDSDLDVISGRGG